MIGIIAALESEISFLRSSLALTSAETVSGIEFLCGTLSGKQVVIARSGAGKVSAAVCAQTMCLKYGVSAIINTGVAGALSPELSQGDMVFSTALVQHDMDTSAVGDPIGFVSQINKIYFEADKAMLDSALLCAKALKLPHRSGIIASGDQFVFEAERKKFIVSAFSAIACEMEGAAIAQAAYMNSVPLLAVRSISDSLNDDPILEYTQFRDIAAKRSAEFTCELLKHING